MEAAMFRSRVALAALTLTLGFLPGALQGVPAASADVVGQDLTAPTHPLDPSNPMVIATGQKLGPIRYRASQYNCLVYLHDAVVQKDHPATLFSPSGLEIRTTATITVRSWDAVTIDLDLSEVENQTLGQWYFWLGDESSTGVYLWGDRSNHQECAFEGREVFWQFRLIAQPPPAVSPELQTVSPNAEYVAVDTAPGCSVHLTPLDPPGATQELNSQVDAFLMYDGSDANVGNIRTFATLIRLQDRYLVIVALDSIDWRRTYRGTWTWVLGPDRGYDPTIRFGPMTGFGDNCYWTGDYVSGRFNISSKR
jgi:hypothetical protein